MPDPEILGLLSGIPLLSDAESRSISAENPNGERGGGGRAVPGPNDAGFDLGKGWKIRPCITLEKGATVTLADIEGPGILNHIWITVREKAYRDCILRFCWDSEATPSIEVPLGDFFCNGHALRCNINSLPIAVNPSGGFNCYFPMPFRSRAVITIENQHEEAITGFFYQVDYSLGSVPENAGYLHAQWRRSMTTRENPEHTLLDRVKGQGHYVGTYLAWTQFSDGWWGEGEIKFYLDGDKEHPTICGTGTEDYFGGAWCFGETYSTAFLGYPLWQKEPGQVPKHGLYRWHLMDPIRFARDLRVTIQALGWWPNRRYQPLTDDIASLAYWYQTEPHAPFPEMPPAADRRPR
jgi:hypothetical protein